MGFVGVAPGTTTIQLPDGSTIALGDWIDDKLYGTVQWQNGDNSELLAFSAGRSQPIPGGNRIQTRVDTNISRDGVNGLPKDWEMLVYGWGIKFVRVMRPPDGATEPILGDTGGALSDPPSLRTVFNVDRVTSFIFNYNDKNYTFGVPQDYPQGHGFTVTTTNPLIELVNNGVPSPRDRLALVLPVHLREGLGFVGTFQPETALVISQPASDGGAALTFLDMKLYMYGLLKRTVT